LAQPPNHERAAGHTAHVPSYLSRFERTMKHAAAWACAIVSCALLAGCEIGVEQPPGGGQQLVPAGAQQHGASTRRVARGHLRFVEGYQKGYAQAVAQGKPMLLFFTAEWCRYCHQMADEAFTNPQVVSLSEHFVCILVDADVEPSICQKYQVSGYPTVQFLSARGAPLDRIVGKKPGHQLMMAMQAALQNVARRNEAEADTRAR